MRHESRSRQLEKIECRRARRVFEKQIGLTAELLHLDVLVDDNRGGSIRAQHDPVGHFQKLAPEICAGGCRSSREMRELKSTLRNEVGSARRRPRYFRINLVFPVQQFEKLVINPG